MLNLTGYAVMLFLLLLVKCTGLSVWSAAMEAFFALESPTDNYCFGRQGTLSELHLTGKRSVLSWRGMVLVE